MTKKEFFEKIENAGLDIKYLPVVIDNPKPEDALVAGISYEDGKWEIYFTDERYKKHVVYSVDAEEEAYGYLFNMMISSMYDLNILNKYVTPDIYFMDKKEACKLFEKKYELNENEAIKLFNDILADMVLITELKYNSVNDKFLPDGFGRKFRGYTSEKLFNEAYLTIPETFRYMLFLRDEPEKALDYLKKVRQENNSVG